MDEKKFTIIFVSLKALKTKNKEQRNIRLNILFSPPKSYKNIFLTSKCRHDTSIKEINNCFWMFTYRKKRQKKRYI